MEVKRPANSRTRGRLAAGDEWRHHIWLLSIAVETQRGRHLPEWTREMLLSSDIVLLIFRENDGLNESKNWFLSERMRLCVYSTRTGYLKREYSTVEKKIVERYHRERPNKTNVQFLVRYERRRGLPHYDSLNWSPNHSHYVFRSSYCYPSWHSCIFEATAVFWTKFSSCIMFRFEIRTMVTSDDRCWDGQTCKLSESVYFRHIHISLPKIICICSGFSRCVFDFKLSAFTRLFAYFLDLFKNAYAVRLRASIGAQYSSQALAFFSWWCGTHYPNPRRCWPQHTTDAEEMLVIVCTIILAGDTFFLFHVLWSVSLLHIPV